MEKINLSKLRERAERADSEYNDWHAGIDYPEGVTAASPAQVFALIEAVEAAFRLREDGWTFPDFNAALDKFSLS